MCNWPYVIGLISFFHILYDAVPTRYAGNVSRCSEILSAGGRWEVLESLAEGLTVCLYNYYTADSTLVLICVLMALM
jgi:hypothetical protein